MLFDAEQEVRGQRCEGLQGGEGWNQQRGHCRGPFVRTRGLGSQRCARRQHHRLPIVTRDEKRRCYEVRDIT